MAISSEDSTTKQCKNKVKSKKIKNSHYVPHWYWGFHGELLTTEQIKKLF